MRQVVQCLCLLLPAAVLGLLSGCSGLSANPSYFPYLKFPDDIIRTHAKPGGRAYYANFDPHAVRLEVRPLDTTNPVRQQHVIIATIYDKDNVPRRNRRVEWMLEGVGQIVEVDESGCLPGRGYKIDNRYAVSYTNYFEHRVTRGNLNPNDDFQLRPGQTWCVVTSAVEGDTYVTVYAPEIVNWDVHKVVTATHWVDAEWSLPANLTARAGSEQVLTTNVFKHTDRQPLANYRVRYRIIDGPPAVFAPSRTQEAVAISDLSGNANVTIAQIAPQPGVNRISIEIVRPPDPTSPSASGIVIGRGETTVEWQAPRIGLTVVGPASAGLNQEVTYTYTIVNTGTVESQALTLRNAVPDGLMFVRSTPQALLDNNQLIWALGSLPGGQQHVVQAVFRTANRQMTVQNCAVVTTVEGLRDEKCATTQLVMPLLNVTLTGPDTAAVGAPISYQVVVTNPGSGPATNVGLGAVFDPGMEHESKSNTVELQLGTLGPGEARPVPLVLRARQPGQFTTRVTATADGNLQSKAEKSVTVQAGQLSLAMRGPAARYVERPVVWDLVVKNTSNIALNNVTVRDQLPQEVTFQSATEGGMPSGGYVVWNLGTMQPGQERVLQVTARCATATVRTVNQAVANADGDATARTEAMLEIRGLPAAFLLEVGDTVDPVPVNGRTSYRITVTNTGTLPGNQIEIVAMVPAQMSIVNANGPTQPQVQGNRIVFPRVDSLQPKQALNYVIEVEARQPGDARLRVELRSPALGAEPVVEEESTNVYQPARTAGPTSQPQGPPADRPAPPQPAEKPAPAPVVPKLPPVDPTPGSPLPPGPSDPR